MKKIKKLIFLFLFILFVKIDIVEAAKVSCVYPYESNYKINITYDSSSGKINYQHNGIPYTQISGQLSATLFVNADSSYKCPSTLYYTLSGSGRSVYMNLLSNASENSRKLNVDLNTSTIPEKADKEKTKVCSVTSINNLVTSITVDLDSQTINGCHITGYNTTCNLNFNDVISNNKCKEDAKIYITCDRGYCTVSNTGDFGTGNMESSDPNDINNKNDNPISPSPNAPGVNPDVENLKNKFLGSLYCGTTNDNGTANFTFPKILPDITSTVYNLFKIVIPVLLIIMGMIDMFKATTAGKEDEMKKAQKKFVQRLISGVCALLVFIIVETVVNFIAEGTGDNNAMNCVNCFINGSKECKVAKNNNVNNNNSSVTTSNFVIPFQDGAQYKVTSNFGNRDLNGDGIKENVHHGMDLVVNNSVITAAANGIVVKSEFHSSMGNYVKIKHEIKGKTYYSIYMHMQDNSVIVREGQSIKAKEKIGLMGSTGNSTAAHLHFEITTNPNYADTADSIDPRTFINFTTKINEYVSA